ncbi:hypothetical protein DHEL01_v210197 [Diaporthe helianthi]|uniref:Uncharacterized protein n=1 Tax=Diaporthe helianthi TaxID=158607 RepID=A0A2P5HMD0_DIAHE|nr:hypothetical protein DHEL01_v210197 [Diaporthe helianthi]
MKASLFLLSVLAAFAAATIDNGAKPTATIERRAERSPKPNNIKNAPSPVVGEKGENTSIVDKRAESTGTVGQ